MTRSVLLLLLMSVNLYPAVAFGGFDVQIYGGGGRGSAEFQSVDGAIETLSFDGNDLGVTTHLSPIETLPFSLGVGFVQENPELSGGGKARYRSLVGQQISVEVMAWYPLNGFAIFGRVGEIIRGSYRAVAFADEMDRPGSAYLAEMNYQGLYGATGLGAALTSGFGVFCEYRAKLAGQLFESQRYLESRQASGRRAKKIGSMTSSSVLAGIELGM